jgi:hypothetical protein
VTGPAWAAVSTGTASAGDQAVALTAVTARTPAATTETAMVSAPAVALALAAGARRRRIRTARHHPFRQFVPIKGYQPV